MGQAGYEVEVITFRFLPDFTEVEVWCGPASDGTLGIQGVQRKAFGKDRSALDILQNEIAGADYLLW